MAIPSQTRHFYEFGDFRLDATNRLLSRSSGLVPLAPKVVDTLLVLVENAGQVLNKDALLRAVWPDTFVEESNLAHNVSVLRKALGDGADGQPYIETLSKRGYRFVGAVTESLAESSTAWSDGGQVSVRVKSNTEPAADSRASAAIPEAPAVSRPWDARLALAMVSVLTLALLLLVGVVKPGWLLRFSSRQTEFVQRQLTANPSDNGVYRAVISPDGKYLAYTDLNGIYLRSIDTGEARTLSLPPGLCFR